MNPNTTLQAEIHLSVVVPLYNEEKIIPELCERLSRNAALITDNYELILVNDGSKDNTFLNIKAQATKNDKIKYIQLSRNFGHQLALSAGLRFAKGACIIIIDGDLQDPPELFPELYAKYKEGYAVVAAKRSKRKGESIFKKVTAKLFYKLLAKLTSVDIPLDVGDYRLIDRKVVDVLNDMPEQHKFLRGQIAWLGFKQTEILFERDERKYGKTSYSIRKMMRFAMDGISAFSHVPLRFATTSGFIVSFFTFIVILYALYSKFILNRAITGWTSLIISSMFIGGIQLICIGIIGEYIGRINSDVRKRPLFIVDETNIS